jgi:hypothetical protein
MSDANRVSLSYAGETVFGVTPSGPAPTLKYLRFVSEKLALSTSVATSKELRSDRQVADVIRTDLSEGGSIDIELSYGAYDDLLLYALQGASWAAAVTQTLTTLSTVTGTQKLHRSAGSFISDGYKQYSWVEVSGFATAANNGIFKITAIDATDLTLVGATTLVTEAAGPSVTVKQGEYITNGITLKSLVMEKAYLDLATTFTILNGMCIDGMELKIAAKEMVTGSFSLLGKIEASAAATCGAGYTMAPSNDVMNAIDNIVAILEAGVAASGVSASFKLANSLRQRTQIATLGPVSIGSGTIAVDGSFVAYFANPTLANKHRNFTDSSIAFIFRDAQLNSYAIDFPKVNYTKSDILATGINEDVMVDMGFTASRHASENVTIRITRFPFPAA